MGLEQHIMTAMKTAMKAKNQTALAALRAVKSELLLAKTSGNENVLSDTDELKIVQKLIKQRKDSARIFEEQGRTDLSEPELAQAEVLHQFLPEQLSDAEIESKIATIISQIGAQDMKDMGKVMAQANAQLAGKADGRTISTIVKQKLS